jgi:hypothetical protein
MALPCNGTSTTGLTWFGWPTRSREVDVADLDAAIRAKLLADALAPLNLEEMAMHCADCTVRYASAIKAALDAADEFRGDHILNAATAVDAIEQAIASALGVPQAEKPQP